MCSKELPARSGAKKLAERAGELEAAANVDLQAKAAQLLDTETLTLLPLLMAESSARLWDAIAMKIEN